MIGVELNNQLLVSGLWSKAATQEEVFVVLHNRALPYMEDPENCTQNDYLEEEQSESVVIVFLSSECANLYANTVVETHDDVRPSSLVIRTIKLSEVFEMVEELNEVSRREFGAPVRIDLVEQLNKETLITDTIYSTYATKH